MTQQRFRRIRLREIRRETKEKVLRYRALAEKFQEYADYSRDRQDREIKALLAMTYSSMAQDALLFYREAKAVTHANE